MDVLAITDDPRNVRGVDLHSTITVSIPLETFYFIFPCATHCCCDLDDNDDDDDEHGR